jgi:hypothetical protein
MYIYTNICIYIYIYIYIYINICIPPEFILEILLFRFGIVLGLLSSECPGDRISGYPILSSKELWPRMRFVSILRLLSKLVLDILRLREVGEGALVVAWKRPMYIQVYIWVRVYICMYIYVYMYSVGMYTYIYVKIYT